MTAAPPRSGTPLASRTLSAFIAIASVLTASGCGTAFRTAASGGSTDVSTTFEVTSYGATGNGATDDSSAITDALNAAVAGGGGTVHFACGNYFVGTVSPLAPGGRSLLYLSGAHSITITGEGACSHILTDVPQKTLFEVNNSSNIVVSNLYLTAVNAIYQEQYGFGGGSALRLSAVQGGSVSQIVIDGATAGAIYLTAGTSGVSVTNNTVHDTYGAGIWEDNCGGSNNQNCLPYLPPANNIYESNTLINTTQAQLSAIDLDDGNAVSNSLVSNNTISWTHGPLASNPEVHCIQVNNASNVMVSGNSCSGTPWDGIVVTTGAGGQSNNDTVESNTITSSGSSSIGGSGIVVYDDPQGLGIAGITVEYNKISIAGDDGIRLYAASSPGNIHDGTVSQNTVYDSDQRIKGTRFGIDIERSTQIGTLGNTVSGDGTCIAVGINSIQSDQTTAGLTPNTIYSILGVPIEVH